MARKKAEPGHMTDWLEELDRLEREVQRCGRCEGSQCAICRDTRYFGGKLRTYARELIDAAKRDRETVRILNELGKTLADLAATK